MSLDDPYVAALGATVECFTNLPGEVKDGFHVAFVGAIDEGKDTFVYGGSTFNATSYDGFPPTKVSTTIALGEPLPSVFEDGHLSLSVILVKCPVIPETLFAGLGWYAGPSYGFPGCGCMVDPTVEHADGPAIYSRGEACEGLTNQQLFDATTNLFIEVMRGEIG